MYFAILKMIVREGMQPNYEARGDRALTFDEETYLNDKALARRMAQRRRYHEDVVHLNKKLENGAARRLQKP